MQARPALQTRARGRSRDTRSKPCSHAYGSLWLRGGPAAGPRKGLCLQNASPDSHPHPSSTQGSFLTVRNPKQEKPGWGGGEKQAFNLKQQHVGKQPGGRWGELCPRGPFPRRGRWGIRPAPPTPTALWVLVLACPSDTPVPVTESARPHLSLPRGPTSPMRPPQKRPSQTSGLATLSLKHCLPGCPWRRATLPTQHHLRRHRKHLPGSRLRSAYLMRCPWLDRDEAATAAAAPARARAPDLGPAQAARAPRTQSLHPTPPRLH